MKKIKWTLMALAIIFSIGGAFATRPHPPKGVEAGLYYYNGSVYVPVVGNNGTGYICTGTANTCTYFFDSSTQTYNPYNTGNYTPVGLTGK
jgi:hypothetical protein